MPEGCSARLAAIPQWLSKTWHLPKKSLVISALMSIHRLGTPLDLLSSSDAGRGREMLHGNRTVLSAPVDAAPGRARGRSIT
jgi:hypothetical protein